MLLKVPRPPRAGPFGAALMTLGQGSGYYSRGRTWSQQIPFSYRACHVDHSILVREKAGATGVQYVFQNNGITPTVERESRHESEWDATETRSFGINKGGKGSSLLVQTDFCGIHVPEIAKSRLPSCALIHRLVRALTALSLEVRCRRQSGRRDEDADTGHDPCLHDSPSLLVISDRR